MFWWLDSIYILTFRHDGFKKILFAIQDRMDPSERCIQITLPGALRMIFIMGSSQIRNLLDP